ncbi:YtxH domain-containing protein [Neobacillus notoginsengisoli]|uniref:YtxH domain-containing protein n=1 Tax=Neobacillus notoginsengisoli TaxID=1578198 RepID=A0A417YUH3_9BACI|nr:YtxH domain-containing protein [Neobacillus notoginsengisoli]RHW40778.1 YtxH domain-containing protein [Neobacillus notoginsengisoli]
MAGRDNDMRDYEDRNVTSRDFLTGAVIGGLIGAAAALFLAPKSGREMRETVSGQAAVLKERTAQMKDTMVEKTNELTTMTKEKTSSLTQAVAQQSSNLMDKVKGNTENLGEQGADEQEDETEYIPLEMSNKPFEELTLADDTEVKEKLEDIKEALDEEESKYNS